MTYSIGINTPKNTPVKDFTATAVSVIAVFARTKNRTAALCVKSRNIHSNDETILLALYYRKQKARPLPCLASPFHRTALALHFLATTQRIYAKYLLSQHPKSTYTNYFGKAQDQ